MATYRFVSYDISETLKQNYDDAEVNLIQIIYWIQVVANRLRAARIPITEGGMYLSVFDSVPVKMDTAHTPVRKYIELPEDIYDFPFEMAVNYITYCINSGDCCQGPAFAQANFTPTTPLKSRRLYFGPYEKPSPSNVYFYRVGDKIYFLGIECIEVKCLEAGLYTALDPTQVCDLDEEIPVSADQIEIIKFQVMKIARFATLIPKDLVNDGTGQIARTQEAQVPEPEAQ